AQIFSAIYIITLRALHQPQGDKQEINTPSVAYWKTIKNMLRSALRVVFNCLAKLEKVYFLFIALKRMAAF
ncbi:MAG: hypothetical protein SO142_05010, partial [Prevotella sp.]|nr:hypothetical protein [Prevotella sp.]